MKKKSTAPFGADRWIVTRAKYLRMLAPFASTEETRLYLGGIYIAPAAKGIVLVATDGHRMGIVHDENGAATKPFICPIGKRALAQKLDIDALAVFAGADLHFLDADNPPKRRTVLQPLFTSAEPALEGDYPAWWKVVPVTVTRRLRPMSINARYVGAFAKVGEAAGLKDGNRYGFNFYQSGGASDALIVRNPYLPEFVGIQMPMRIIDTDPLPRWLMAARKAA